MVPKKIMSMIIIQTFFIEAFVLFWCEVCSALDTTQQHQQQQKVQQKISDSNLRKNVLSSSLSSQRNPEDFLKISYYKNYKQRTLLDEQQQHQQQKDNDSDKTTSAASAIKIAKSSSSLPSTFLKTSLNDLVVTTTIGYDPSSSTTSNTNNNFDTTNKAQKVSQHQQSQQHRRAVVHIGPHKTASTTIQDMISKLQVALQMDGYYMPGTWPIYSNAVNMQNLADCFTKNSAETKETCDVTLYNDLIELGKDDTKPNLLLTAEAFAYDIINTTQIQHVLQPWQNDITILAYYRRFYDWCLSYYNMETRYTLIEYRVSLYEWISNISRLYALYNDMYTVGVTKRWQEQFGIDNVRIYNMHDPINNDLLLENFFCRLLPNATNSCNALYERTSMKQDGNKSLLRMNPSTKTYVYSEIAYEAYKLNYLEIETPGPINWTHIIDRVQYHQEIDLQRPANDYDDKYIICPEQNVFDTIFDLSIQAEKVLFPEFFATPDGEAILRNEFAKYQTDNKFCSVNVTAVLQDTQNNDWGDFFTGRIFSQP